MIPMKTRLFYANVEALEDPVLFQRLYQSVSETRKKKVDRIRPVSGKRLSLGAGALLEAALAEVGVDFPRLEEDSNGKPFLPDHPGLRFNLSHSGARVLCALSGEEIGCDVESVQKAHMNIAARYFHPEEYEAIRSVPDGEARNRLFYRFWTLKESFMKATGLGFQLPLDAFRIKLDTDGITVEQALDSQAYFFRTFSDLDYEYALCGTDRALDQVCLIEHGFGELAKLLEGRPTHPRNVQPAR